LLPEIERQQRLGKDVVFRADAAFSKPELYEALEERDVKYAIRLPANDNLQRNITELLTRPVGRPSHKPVVRYKSFLYRAASWKTVRRLVAKVEFHCGELFPRVEFIVTNLPALLTAAPNSPLTILGGSPLPGRSADKCDRAQPTSPCMLALTAALSGDEVPRWRFATSRC
jgi:Transposase DDE domain group 1